MFYYVLAFLVIILLPLAVLFLRAKKYAGEDLSHYDSSPAPFAVAEPSEGLEKLNAYINDMFGGSTNRPANASSGWEDKRERFDAEGLARTYDGVEFRKDTINVDGREITGAWTLLPDSDPTRRLLYMHGGAFTVGSDISHRPLTVQLAKRTGMAVFTPNYRLMPENPRRASIDDARAAYHWILEHGPDGKTPLAKFAVAGDSAGGNLALMLSNWARKQAERQPDAVVAFSPTVDTTYASPTFKTNLATDHMLRPMIAPVLKAPRVLLLPGLAKHLGMNPSHPDISPIFDDLSGLPPTFIQASADEVLHGDAIRFTAKAQAADSPVTFQSWGGKLPHVWPIFDNYIPEALSALDEVQAFLAKHV